MLPSKKTIGIIGGGQLGKMLIEASRPWNVNCVVLENDPHCPASLVASKVIMGTLYDEDKIRELASISDVLTFEIEHINVEVLLDLESKGHTIIPSPKILQIIQDKGLQKEFFTANHLHTAPYVLTHNNDDIVNAIEKMDGDKVVVKTRVGGYDGKGVQIVSKLDIQSGTYRSDMPSVVEQFYTDIVEFAVIVSRDTHGNHVTFPLIEMYFNPQSNLVEFLFSPARVNVEIEKKCKDLATAAIDAFRGVGLFAVEMFVTKNGEVLINEIAPRPHNSGHHTIEGCYTSQFEQLNRILLGLPLGSTELVQPAAMINLVGPAGLEGDYVLKNTEKLLQMEGVYVHLYNKKVIKPNRKMGHITVLAPTLEALLEKANQVKELIEFTQHVTLESL